MCNKKIQGVPTRLGTTTRCVEASNRLERLVHSQSSPYVMYIPNKKGQKKRIITFMASLSQEPDTFQYQQPLSQDGTRRPHREYTNLGVTTIATISTASELCFLPLVGLLRSSHIKPTLRGMDPRQPFQHPMKRLAIAQRQDNSPNR